MKSRDLMELDFSQLQKMDFYMLSTYDILENDDHEFMIAFSKDVPETIQAPTFFYDEGAHGLMMKNDNTLVLCDYINPAARKGLARCKEILIAEVMGALEQETANSDEESFMKQEYKAAVVICGGLEKVAQRLAEYHGIELD